MPGQSSFPPQLRTEIDAAYLYDTFAALETDATIADVFRQLAAIEGSHAKKYIAQQAEKGIKLELPPPTGRARTLGWIARKFGYEYVLPILMNTEKGLAGATVRGKMAEGKPISGQEWNHVAILKSLGELPGQVSGEKLARLEGKHRNIGGNALRAAVLGANDGLVSNLSLVMGVAGADSSGQAILIAGFAGLLAGSISMALGEWLSVQSSRELYQRQLDIEMEELENNPEEEQHELALIYQAKGIAKADAQAMAQRLLSNKATAHETLIKEELGFDPGELGGSAWTAALTSFFLFAVGAIIPVIPFIVFEGLQATIVSVAVSTLGLFAIGAAITLFTGRSIFYSGFRQVLFGLAAAAVTFGIGKLIGVSIT